MCWITQPVNSSGHRTYSACNKVLECVCSVLMLDEAHERSLNTDIAVGLLKKVGLTRIVEEWRTKAKISLWNFNINMY